MTMHSVVLLLHQPQNRVQWEPSCDIVEMVLNDDTAFQVKKKASFLGESGHFYVEKSAKCGCPKCLDTWI